jgi:hypothetical protein
VPRKQPQGLRPQCSAAAVDVQRLPIVLRGSSSVARELDDLEGEWLTCQGRRFNRVSKHALCVKHVKPSPIATVGLSGACDRETCGVRFRSILARHIVGCGELVILRSLLLHVL